MGNSPKNTNLHYRERTRLAPFSELSARWHNVMQRLIIIFPGIPAEEPGGKTRMGEPLINLLGLTSFIPTAAGDGESRWSWAITESAGGNHSIS